MTKVGNGLMSGTLVFILISIFHGNEYGIGRCYNTVLMTIEGGFNGVIRWF